MYGQKNTKADHELVEGDVLILSNDSEVVITAIKEVDGGYMITNDRYGQTFSPAGTKFKIK